VRNFVIYTGYLVRVVNYWKVCPKCAGHLVYVREKKNASRILIDGLVERIITWKTENISEDNINLYHMEAGCKDVIWM
jgi:uncharacterized protein YbaR (Trm112 family)